MNVRSMIPTVIVLTAALAWAPAAAYSQATGTSKPAATKPAEQKPQPPPKPAGTKPTAKPSTAKPAPPNAALRTPSKLKDTAPAVFTANFDTSAGPFVVEVHRAWAPKGADRFYNLVKYGYFDNTRFFRVIPNFMVQFGIHGDPKIQGGWRDANIPDDPVTQSNKRGYITFATAGPNSRTTQVFINFRDNSRLDASGFAPFGQVVSGMESVDKINGEYGEGPQQPSIQSQGNAYLTKEFPKLDYIRKATLGKAPAPPPPPPVKK
jgi:peptidyl-prolyl cis-trans isomerase A (cyclophilin A)